MSYSSGWSPACVNRIRPFGENGLKGLQINEGVQHPD